MAGFAGVEGDTMREGDDSGEGVVVWIVVGESIRQEELQESDEISNKIKTLSPRFVNGGITSLGQTHLN